MDKWTDADNEALAQWFASTEAQTIALGFFIHMLCESVHASIREISKPK